MRSLTPFSRALAGFAAAAALFAAGGAAGWLLRADLDARRDASGEPPTRLIRGDHEDRWRFISPLLECETAEAYLRKPELSEAQIHLRALVEQRQRDGSIANASIYFRQLHDGPWFGIHLRQSYAPASLFKLPVLITVLKRAESDRALLQRTLSYDEDDDLNRMMVHQPAEPLQRGRPYTVEELCRRMARYSDNNATRLLRGLFTQEEYDRTLHGLGVYGELRRKDGRLDVKSVSGFFRVLYNASYLGDEMSELALEMLSHSSFREGILAGIPAGTLVSSKYGEAWVSAELHELHEFAIVYNGDRPYLLGVMAKGPDYPQLTAFIREVSRTIHAEMDASAFRRDLSPASPASP